MLPLLARAVPGGDGAATASAGGMVRAPRWGAEGTSLLRAGTDMAARQERRNGDLRRDRQVPGEFRGTESLPGGRQRCQRRQAVRTALPDAAGYDSLVGSAAGRKPVRGFGQPGRSGT